MVKRVYGKRRCELLVYSLKREIWDEVQIIDKECRGKMRKNKNTASCQASKEFSSGCHYSAETKGTNWSSVKRSKNNFIWINKNLICWILFCFGLQRKRLKQEYSSLLRYTLHLKKVEECPDQRFVWTTKASLIIRRILWCILKLLGLI